jgi:hypothetical protein
MLLVIFSIVDARGIGAGTWSRIRKNPFVNQLPEWPWYIREEGTDRPTEKAGEITQGR